MKTVYTITEDFYEIDLDNVKGGNKYILVERTNIITGKTEYRLRADNGKGIGGNQDYNIKRYHGWRGTTDDISIYAEGLRRVDRVYDIKVNSVNGSRTVKVKLSADLAPDKP